jgi:gliding motility-associated-like protein
MACAGTIEKYWVKGQNGKSTFTWQVTNSVGDPVSPSFFTLLGQMRGDSIQINWDSSLPGGIYTFSVTEHFDNGAIGAPWAEQFVVLNSISNFTPFNSIPNSASICIGDSIKLDPGSGFLDYFWLNNSATSQYIWTRTAGRYDVKLVGSDQSCSYDTSRLIVNPLPYVWLGKDTVLFGENPSITLKPYNPDIQWTYEWSNGSILSEITLDNLGKGKTNVWVEVTDENTCKNSDTIQISAIGYDDLRIPQAFTPNGDGINDKWYFPAPPVGLSLDQDLYPYFEDVNVRVFNRWGKLVWESNNKFIAWDGKDLHGKALPIDSYHYLIKLKTKDRTFTYKGSITIVR